MADAPTLRIGIDARELLVAPTGVGRYLRELLDRWTRPEAGVNHRFVLYVPNPTPEPHRLTSLHARPGIEVRTVTGRGGTLWEQTRLPAMANRDGLDVFFAPAYSAPLALASPLVLTIHDLSFVAHPEWFRWPGGLRRRALARWSARKAVRIVTDSEFSAAEIRRYLDLPASELDVIPLGLSPPTWSLTATPRPAREPLVLYVGSIFNRRHVSDLVRAFARVARLQPHARLVIAGENRTFPREDPAALALHLGIADRVSVRPYVTDAELGELYARARVFAFLSEYEGFGLTPLEALAAGVPTVVYDTPVAREVYADAVDYVTPGALDQVASALNRLLSDANACAERLTRTPAVLARYDWERTARLTLGVLTRAATHGRRP